MLLCLIRNVNASMSDQRSVDSVSDRRRASSVSDQVRACSVLSWTCMLLVSDQRRAYLLCPINTIHAYCWCLIRDVYTAVYD